jgi:hypothetical protein
MIRTKRAMTNKICHPGQRAALIRDPSFKRINGSRLGAMRAASLGRDDKGWTTAENLRVHRTDLPGYARRALPILIGFFEGRHATL